MKPTVLLVSALSALVTTATTAAAAPTEKRTTFDLSSLNNLNSFSSENLNYLLSENQLQLQLLETLGSVNNFDIVSFQTLFQTSSFNLGDLLQLQQLQMLLQLADLGLFNGFDLSTLQLDLLQLGLVSNIGSMDLSQFIPASSLPQIQSIAATVISSTK